MSILLEIAPQRKLRKSEICKFKKIFQHKSNMLMKRVVEEQLPERMVGSNDKIKVHFNFEVEIDIK